MRETRPEEARPDYVSYAEASRRVGLSRQTIWRAARAGEVRVSRIGRATRVDYGSLLDFMARKEV